jgi:dephospho-CoA kinase
MRMVYLIGEPGIGKTTLMRELTGRLGPAVEMTKPLAHRLGAGWLELGRQRGTFSGTDGLSMSVQPLAVAWLRTLPSRLVLGEGDRLGNASFMEMVGVYADVRLAALTAPPEVGEERRRNRPQQFTFNPTWVKGRISKVERQLERADLVLDARRPVRELADELMLLVEG